MRVQSQFNRDYFKSRLVIFSEIASRKRKVLTTRALQLRREARMVSPAMGAAMIGTMYFLRANCAQHGGKASGGALISASLLKLQGSTVTYIPSSLIYFFASRENDYCSSGVQRIRNGCRGIQCFRHTFQETYECGSYRTAVQ